MIHTRLISGGGRYADLWHPFDKTSRELAALLQDEGHLIAIDSRPDKALACLAQPAHRPDLLILNIGNPATGAPAAAAKAGLMAYLESGRPMLAIHSTGTAFSQWPEWEDILGGRWVRGVSMHPPQETCRILIRGHGHPIVEGVSDFDIFDERYSYLRTCNVTPLVEHEYEQRPHPLLWTHRFGPAKVVYDALGHDESAYASPEHRALLRQSVSWLLEDP